MSDIFSLIIKHTLCDDICQLKLHTPTGTVLYPVQYMRSCDVYFWYCASVIDIYVMALVLREVAHYVFDLR